MFIVQTEKTTKKETIATKQTTTGRQRNQRIRANKDRVTRVSRLCAAVLTASNTRIINVCNVRIEYAQRTQDELVLIIVFSAFGASMIWRQA
mmetsp:Transcript_33781/g.54049  ORF Transcript_33781/g.54049 Transcript_33781/m.54049 type:complete len:92 (+) Transcript_33781:146-421(+)